MDITVIDNKTANIKDENCSLSIVLTAIHTSKTAKIITKKLLLSIMLTYRQCG